MFVYTLFQFMLGLICGGMGYGLFKVSRIVMHNTMSMSLFLAMVFEVACYGIYRLCFSTIYAFWSPYLEEKAYGWVPEQYQQYI